MFYRMFAIRCVEDHLPYVHGPKLFHLRYDRWGISANACKKVVDSSRRRWFPLHELVINAFGVVLIGITDLNFYK